MATLTVVLTYSGTDPDESVTSMTIGGTAYGSVTDADIRQAQRLMRKARMRLTADFSPRMSKSGGK